MEARLLKKEKKGQMTARDVDHTMTQEVRKRDRETQDALLKVKHKRKMRKIKLNRAGETFVKI